MSDVDEIAIVNDSISHVIPSIPSLPYLGFLGGSDKIFYGGTQLPNGDLLLAGGGLVHSENLPIINYHHHRNYYHYRKGSNYWEILGTMKMARHQYASVLIDGCLFTSGGIDRFGNHTSYLEKFSFEGGVEEKKSMPIALTCHTATVFGKYKMLVCGGQTSERGFMVKYFLN